MNIKITSLILIFILLSSTIVVVSEDKEENYLGMSSKSDFLSFKKLKISEKDDFLKVDFDNSNSRILIPGKPILPVYIKTYYFEIGTKITNVNCNSFDTSIIDINKKIEPASNPIIKTDKKVDRKIGILDDKTYSSENLSPKNPFDYKISCGMINNKDKLILNLYLYPVRYQAGENKLFHTKNFDIKISYENLLSVKETNDEYDMVIICPNIFKDQLERLVEHKNKFGIKTKIKTTNSIYIDSLKGLYDGEGRDNPEKIKYFIKWAHENWGIEYVLLAGGKIGQLLRWYVPVRYTNLDDTNEVGQISDLYYSDLYRYNESTDSTEFEDWDSNGNGIFAEFSYDEEKTDNLDLYPDIKVGRLAFRNKREVVTVVDKIINYEENTYGSDWFKNFLAVGGDTDPPARWGEWDESRLGYYEGEIETNLSASYLKPLGFNIKKLFTSNSNFTNTQDLIDEINNGAGLMHLSGHGNPSSWTNFPPDAENESDSLDYLFTNFDMKKLKNKEKLPICVIGACSSSRFDVGLLNILKGIFTEGFFDYFFGKISSGSGGFKKGDWVFRCWSWNMIIQKNGGSIATIGNSGIGYGNSDLNCTDRLDGYICTRFFYNYNNLTNRGIYNLGNIHSKTISDYLTNIYKVNIDEYDSWMDIKTVEGWTLLGDPSLRVGGYPST